MIEKIRPEVEDREVGARETETGEVEGREAGALPDGRYLLFDSGCATCADVARSVERETEGWLSARSLHEVWVQKQLSEARPDWKWEPGILEIQGGKTFVFTGLKMKVRLLVGLGPRKTACIANIVRRARAGEFDLEMSLSPSKEDPERYKVDSIKHIDRRTALKRAAALGIGAALLPMLPQSVLAQETAPGEGESRDSRDARVVVRRKRMTRRQAERAVRAARRDKNGGRLHRHLGGEKFLPNAASVAGGYLTVEKALTSGARVVEKSWVVKVDYRNKGSREDATFVFSVTTTTTAAGDQQIKDRKVRCDHSVFTRAGGLDTFAVRSDRVQRVNRIEDLKDFRNELRAKSSLGDKTQVTAKSACTFCQIIASTMLGLGCIPYTSVAIGIACGPVAGWLCWSFVTAMQGALCTTAGFLTVPVLCNEVVNAC